MISLLILGVICYVIFRLLNGAVRLIVGGDWSPRDALRVVVTTGFLVGGISLGMSMLTR